MKARLALALALAVSGAAVPAHAHHSFAAEFDINKPVRLVGKVTRIEWSNPHTYFYIDVVDANGTVTNWAIEGPSPGAQPPGLAERRFESRRHRCRGGISRQERIEHCQWPPRYAAGWTKALWR